MDYLSGYRRFAGEQGFEYRDYESEVKPWHLNGNEINVRYCLLKKEEVVFYAYSTYAPGPYMNTAYCGLYTNLNRSLGLDCTIIKRIPVFDLFKKRNRTGIGFIDKNVIVSGKDCTGIVLLDEEIIREYEALWNKNKPVKMVFGSDSPARILLSHEKRHAVFGLEFNEWVTYEALSAIFPDLLRIVGSVRDRSAEK